MIREATDRVSSSPTALQLDLISLLVFRVGEEVYTLPATDVASVTDVGIVRSIPHRSNAIIRGLCTVDGELLICASLVDLLELSTTDHDPSNNGPTASQRRVVVLGEETDRWAFEVDQVLGVIAVEKSTFKNPPMTVERSNRRFTHRIVPLDEQTMASLLDTQRVVAGFRAALT
jgi:chemotaxis-related protein WspD